MKRFLMLLSMLPFVAGCYGHVISEQARTIADPSLTFPALQADPKEHVGKHIILGGMIAGLKNTKDGSQLELVSTELSYGDEPVPYQKGGRFLAVTPDFLDPLIYKKNKYVTLFGEVQGEKKKALDEYEYTYPVLLIKEIYLWDERSLESNHYNYPPPYPYYYDPFFYPHGPFWPHPFYRHPFYW